MNNKADWQASIAGIQEIQSIRVDRIKTKAAIERLIAFIENTTNDKLNKRQSQDK